MSSPVSGPTSSQIKIPQNQPTEPTVQQSQAVHTKSIAEHLFRSEAVNEATEAQVEATHARIETTRAQVEALRKQTTTAHVPQQHAKRKQLDVLRKRVKQVMAIMKAFPFTLPEDSSRPEDSI